jgi:hypothetical protein
MSVPLHFVVVGLGQVTNLCNPLSFALMLVFGVLHHPFIWQCYHCLSFIKFLYFLVVAWCVTKLKGGECRGAAQYGQYVLVDYGSCQYITGNIYL